MEEIVEKNKICLNEFPYTVAVLLSTIYFLYELLKDAIRTIYVLYSVLMSTQQ